MPKPRRARITDLPDNPIRSILTTPTEGVDKVRSLGVTLKDSEITCLGELAAGLNVSRNALACFLLRYGLAEMEAGRLVPETTKVVTVKLKR